MVSAPPVCSQRPRLLIRGNLLAKEEHRQRAEDGDARPTGGDQVRGMEGEDGGKDVY